MVNTTTGFAQPSIAIGVHVHAEPDRLRRTLASLDQHTDRPVELLLLADGADAATRVCLSEYHRLRQLAFPTPRGAAACFNRLCAATQTDMVVLLESGCEVGPGWLRNLLAALDAAPSAGLAGPSTNMAWNEQCVFPNGFATFEEVTRLAEEVGRRFGDTWRTLEPLHSLADFCYVVRREVIDAIGSADEAYGLGPCWEMDYNIRAARAGFHGVWACGAYVHRVPFTARRARYERLLMEDNKRRYQSKFCRRQLLGVDEGFRPHCRGDACPNFAPADMVVVHTPPVDIAEPLGIALAQFADASYPLVSCIMPTAGRRGFIADAVRCFQQQDYPRLELLVVDDGADPVSDCLPDDQRIRYVRLDEKLVLGRKRNVACAEAGGEFIVHWDDDDWYPPWRVSAQIERLRQGNARVCGSSRLYYRELQSGRAWEYRYTRSDWVAGNTLAYRRDFWQAHPFPEVQVGEDAIFVAKLRGQGLIDMGDPDVCVATIHAGNTSRKNTRGSLWTPLQEEERVALMNRIQAAAQCQSFASPLVSCIMPTSDRRQFIPLALESFRSQTYTSKELIIVDDGRDPIGDLVIGYPEVRYIRLEKKLSIGAKRNLACGQARGGVIAHWDDDDWYGPDRLERQVLPIVAGHADLTGLENRYVMVLPSGDCWTVDAQLHKRMFVGNVHGGTLVFRKAIWESGVSYPDVNLAEDAALLSAAQRTGARVAQVANNGSFVYVRHGRNAWQFDAGRFLDPRGWRRTDTPSGFGSILKERYRHAAANMAL